MDSDLFNLLNLDIRQTQEGLQEVLERIATASISPDVLKQGLCAAHTLKALSAVRGIAHLEEYSAQLEQLFLKGAEFQPEEVYCWIQPQIQTIQREFREACLLHAGDESVKSHPTFSGKLIGLIEKLHRTDQERSQLAYEVHLKQLGKGEISVESIFRSFIPWIQRISQETRKKIQVEPNVPVGISLHASSVAPLQIILVHLLRNAAFHGIEPPGIRAVRGKTETGTIELSAEVDGDVLSIAVSDDGQGLSQERAPEACLSCSEQVSFPFPEEPIPKQCESDSIADTSIYAVSNSHTGLGIGLHIVSTQVSGLNGEFELKSIPFTGTSAIVRIPTQSFKEQGDD